MYIIHRSFPFPFAHRPQQNRKEKKVKRLFVNTKMVVSVVLVSGGCDNIRRKDGVMDALVSIFGSDPTPEFKVFVTEHSPYFNDEADAKAKAADGCDQEKAEAQAGCYKHYWEKKLTTNSDKAPMDHRVKEKPTIDKMAIEVVTNMKKHGQKGMEAIITGIQNFEKGKDGEHHRLWYYCMAPDKVSASVQQVTDAKATLDESEGAAGIVDRHLLDKPIGESKEASEELIKALKQTFKIPDKNLFFIDHFLGY